MPQLHRQEVISFACTLRLGDRAGILGTIRKLEFACPTVMSYGFGRIGATLIPDNSKPTVTWGRKAMGLHCLYPATAMVVARLPKESRHELALPLPVALGPR